MTSFEIYKKTFRFTLMRIVSGLIGTALVAGLPVAAYFLSGRTADETRIFICGGAFLAACLIVGLLSHFIGYLFRAGQIAMAAEGIAKGALPEDPYREGKARVKQRFGAVAVFFAIERIINRIVSEISHAVTKVTDKLSRGGKNDAGRYAGAAVSLFVSAVTAFLCACCMGWVFVHPDENPWRAACDGALVYFKNWKDLLKNAGKIVAMVLVSLLVLGVPLFVLTHLVTDGMPAVNAMAEDLAEFLEAQKAEEAADEGETVSLTPEEWKLVFEGAVAFVLWCVIHSALVSPFIMISVMRRYLNAGLANPPARAEDGKLAGLSKAFRKAAAKAEA